MVITLHSAKQSRIVSCIIASVDVSMLAVASSCNKICKQVIVIPWVVRLYVEIIHELKRVDYLTYRWTNMV